jgi:hypothetical protein
VFTLYCFYCFNCYCYSTYYWLSFFYSTHQIFTGVIF